MTTRVVVTGMGAVTPVGPSVDAMWEALTAGASGIGRVTHFDTAGYDTTIAAEVRGFDPCMFVDRRDAKRMDRFTQFGVTAAIMAIEDAGMSQVPSPERSGVSFGTGIGGMETFDQQFRVMLDKGPSRVSPFFIPMMISNMAAGNIAMRLGLKGPNATFTTACCASAHSVGDAFKVIQRGDADVMLAGGSEAPITPMAFAGFCSMKAMSTRNGEPERAVRPFDLDRDGFVMGEGGGVVVLESLEHARGRGARIMAEIVGYGQSADAYHITAPPPDGDGAARAMAAALRDARMDTRDIDYINAHGTSTPLNDKIETMAIKRVFGDCAGRLAVGSTKSMTGHLLGAAGIVEMIVCVKAILEGVLPPTINYEKPDPECDLDYIPNTPRKTPVKAAMSNSFGFGGQNVSLIVKAFDE